MSRQEQKGSLYSSIDHESDQGLGSSIGSPTYEYDGSSSNPAGVYEEPPMPEWIPPPPPPSIANGVHPPHSAVSLNKPSSPVAAQSTVGGGVGSSFDDDDFKRMLENRANKRTVFVDPIELKQSPGSQSVNVSAGKNHILTLFSN